MTARPEGKAEGRTDLASAGEENGADCVRSSITGGIGRITLNRVKFRNALNTPMWSVIPVKLKELSRAGASVIIFSGEGGSFASGADLQELQNIACYADASTTWTAIYQALEAVALSRTTTIAAIDGPCIGGGCLLAVSCNLRYATTSSTFGIPVARLGIVLDDATVRRVARVVGTARTFEMISRGNVWSAGDALAMGLLNGVLEGGEFKDKVEAIASEIESNSKATIDATRKALFEPAPTGGRTHDDAVKSYLSADFKERIGKFLDGP